jgi:hypothetical protein
VQAALLIEPSGEEKPALQTLPAPGKVLTAEAQ